MELKFSDVTIRFKQNDIDIEVLSNFSLTIPEGKIIALSGRSGSGKSTAIALAYGLLKPNLGAITWDGNNIEKFTSSTRHEYRFSSIGYSPQDSLAFNDLSVLKNVQLGGSTKESAITHLELLDISRYASVKAGKLSGGEKQRVSIARALAKYPSLILLDEPTASLDARSANLVIKAIQTHREKGAATLIATHDPLILSIADEVIKL
ncbi:MAG: ABC transporter ATP-binding protein [Arcanobacterium sp.]|nr:ABC transporter ATP-binding protein [Arcanobacterium sp.]